MRVGLVLLDRYELCGLIGEGAQSSVWEALDRHTQEHVAVKAISLDEAGWRAEVRDRFFQEARLLEMARNPHLVDVRDGGETEDGYLYLVLEKLTGETLAERMGREGKMPWREALDLALQIARGLEALHAQGIVHRDLKPANVFLHRKDARSAQVAKILDLGISKARAVAADPGRFATLTTTGQVLGTPEYMSYEQAIGARDVDARTDVWALGVVLYEMLAGRRPFEASNVNAVLAAIRRSAPPALQKTARGVPKALCDVVERCLSREQDARYPDGAELVRALEAAKEEGAAEEAREKRQRMIAKALAVVVVAMLVALVFRVVSTPAPVSAPASASAPVPAPASAPVTASVTASVTAPATVSAPVPTGKGPLPKGPRPPVTKVDSAGF